MKSTEINKEIVKAKNIMDKLMVCIKEGKTELYKDYIEASTYYLKLSKHKPKHNLTIV